MSTISKLIFIFFLGAMLFGCANEPAQKQFIYSCASLDSTLIPCLILTDTNKPALASIACHSLNEKWQKFSSLYYNLEIKYGVDIVDKDWKGDFDEITVLLSSAETFVNEKKMRNANQRVRDARSILKQLRQRNGIDFYTDHLIGFEDKMDDFGKGIINKQNISLQLTQSMRAKALLLTKEWQPVKSGKIDNRYYSFSDEKLKAIKQNINKFDKSLVGFNNKLLISDLNVISIEYQKLSKAYSVIYKVFGDFKPYEVKKKLIEPKKVEKPKAKRYNKTKGKVK